MRHRSEVFSAFSVVVSEPGDLSECLHCDCQVEPFARHYPDATGLKVVCPYLDTAEPF